MSYGKAVVMPSAAGGDASGLSVTSVASNFVATLGDLGVAADVTGPQDFPPTVLLLAYRPEDAQGIDLSTVRLFRVDDSLGSWTPIWSSGVQLSERRVWAEIGRPGRYVPVGLPRDPVLREGVRVLASHHAFAPTDPASATGGAVATAFAAILRSDPKQLESLRQRLACIEFQTGNRPDDNADFRHGEGGAVLPFSLPKGASLDALRQRIAALAPPAGGLPEASLFTPPESGGLIHPAARVLASLAPTATSAVSNDWPMYHHDPQHTGVASGTSDISSSTVGRLRLRASIPLDGPVISVPSLVGGKAFVGSGNSTTAADRSGGTLYRIDLASGAIEKKFTFANPVNQSPGGPIVGGSRQGYAGIGSSPAVVDGNVYFSGLDGKVYCLNSQTFDVIWVTDLRNADLAHGQPVQHQVTAEGWSSPLVVNGRVYVGFGEGESDTFGFVYCLDAINGKVIWLFCTNRFTQGANNAPNVVPASAAVSPLPAGFTTHADPPMKGVSVWSSLAFDAGLNRVYVGTGNSTQGDFQPVPDIQYGSGVLALDATTGQFGGFFGVEAGDNYRPLDSDVDVASSPVLYTLGGRRVLALGCKNGSFFVLDASTMAVVARRQLLPYDSSGQPFPNIDPGATTSPNENTYGVFCTAALHSGLGRLFIGLGGYSDSIDSATTPFLRVVGSDTLADAWATSGNNPPKYTLGTPPLYSTQGESGLSSPALVNDVVFASTTKPALYGFSASTGLLLWTAGGLGNPAGGTYVLGPAISGNFVVAGRASGNQSGFVNIYSLP
jgi:outer membrane protein assembly factor BamB